MQLKGLVKFFTAALILFSLWRLSFTFIARNVDNKYNAMALKQVNQKFPNAQGTEKDELVDREFVRITDSLRDEKAFGFLGMNYTYQELKSKELGLGLDLQGGMNVTLEVGLDGLLQSMAVNPKDPGLVRALEAANKMHNEAPANYIDQFAEAYQSVNPGGRLAFLFSKPNQSKITSNSSNEQVIEVLREEAREATNRTYKLLQTRIDKFGVSQPSISLDENKGIITVELAGVKNPENVRQYLQATANLQFWEVYTNQEMAQSLFNANDALKKFYAGGGQVDTVSTTQDTLVAATDSAVADTAAGSLTSILGSPASGDTAASLTTAKSENPLFELMAPMVSQNGQAMDVSIIGTIERKNKDKVLELLNMDVVKNQFPVNVKFVVGENPYLNAEAREAKNPPLGVYALKTVPGSDAAKLEGDHVTSARFDFQPNGTPEISLEFDPQGSSIWAKLTKDNVGRPIAIVLDEFVYSAPNVINEITGGRSSITGSFDVTSGTQLANILQTGKLPAPAKIVQEQIVGPTLGAESIDGGMKSFIFAFLIIFVLMIVYYNTAGIVANIALLLNLLFTFGVLANLNATLTMAGIAGIVLGIGMAVDANVIIFERIKDELAHGDTHENAVDKGYKRSYAPIFDGHITSLITAVVLLIFGLGPIRSFAVTQIIALILSLFTGIMVSRMITDAYMKRGRHFKYFTSFSKKIFNKANFKFIEKRKIAYAISAVFFALGIASFFNGFDYGVEFDGGRSYTVMFDQAHKVSDVREKLSTHLEKHPVVKTIGSSNQLNITTDYMINVQGKDAETQVMTKLYNGLKAENLIPSTVDYPTFSTKYVQSAQVVSPTISDDLKKGALKAGIIAVTAIFIYILLRFRKWQYSLGTILSLLHDAAITLAVFSFARNFVPFALEIDQHFIAALLTVIGFSMNDTVIVFDRIREYFRKTPNADKTQVINSAINDTLSRTIMTSVTVLITALILFIFGGEALRGFAFAMSIGVIAGTYSSIFIAAPVLVDMDRGDSLRVETDKEERIKVLKTQA